MSREQVQSLKFVRETPEERMLRSRLINWKFKSAMRYVSAFGDDSEAVDLLEVLERIHGNSGWTQGDIAVLIGVAVDTLLGRF